MGMFSAISDQVTSAGRRSREKKHFTPYDEALDASSLTAPCLTGGIFASKGFTCIPTWSGSQGRRAEMATDSRVMTQRTFV